MQRHTILMNFGFSDTGSTIVVNASAVTTVDGYQITNIQGLGGGIVNSSNVRGFLNDDVNDIIINDFFSYLTGSTTTEEFSEIYRSDQKLSDVFNDYYTSSIVNNQLPSTAVINNSLTGTVEIALSNNYIHNMDGISPSQGLDNIPMSINYSTRKQDTKNALTTFTNEQSYYIPVFVKRNHKEMARLKFDVCDNIINLLLNPPCPEPPKDIVITTTVNSIFLNWPTVDYASSYLVQSASLIGGPYLTTPVPSNNFSIQGLSNGTEFYFKIASVNPSCVSEYSDIIKAITLSL